MFKFIRARWRFFLCHYLGFTCASAVLAGGASWYPVHISRTFGWSAGEIGAGLGPAFMLAAAVGQLVCGPMVDRMYRRGYRDAQLRWYGVCMLLAAPVGVYATLSGNVWTFIAAISVFTTLIGAMHACAVTALNLVTPNHLRGTGVALYTTFIGLIGGGTGWC
jgi:MFS family permease